MLARRELTRHELRQRLLPYAGDAGASAVDELVDEFAAKSWVSDARYAEAVVRGRKDRYGKAAIAHRLKAAGVSEAAAAEALQGLDSEQEYHAAVALWRRKFRGAPADEREKARQVRFLQARGFALGVVLRVIKAGGRDA
jgi:regulatory protein